MNLIIDIGNTDTKIGLTNNNDIYNIKRIPSDKSSYEKFFSELNKSIFKVFIVSVVSKKTAELVQVLKNNYIIDIKIIDYKDIEKFIKLDIENKEHAGIDRLINAAGSYLMFKKDSIVIDLGTATKIDVVQSKGIFSGGIILPGVYTALHNMIEYCDKLTFNNYKQPVSIIGKNTSECINSGIFYNAVFSIRGFIDNIQKFYKKNFFIIGTGGLVNLFLEAGLFDIIDENFTLKSIVKIVYK